MTLGDDAPDATAFVSAAKARNVPVTVFASSQPDLVFAYERPLVLVRPDGHVAWRGNTFPGQPDDLLATICGFKQPHNIARPALGFGQEGIFLTPPQQAPDTGADNTTQADERPSRIDALVQR